MNFFNGGDNTTFIEVQGSVDMDSIPLDDVASSSTSGASLIGVYPAGAITNPLIAFFDSGGA